MVQSLIAALAVVPLSSPPNLMDLWATRRGMDSAAAAAAPVGLSSRMSILSSSNNNICNINNYNTTTNNNRIRINTIAKRRISISNRIITIILTATTSSISRTKISITRIITVTSNLAKLIYILGA